MRLVDDTLREGMQTPGLTFSSKERFEIAQMVRRAGVKSAVVSYPSAHISEMEFTKTLVNERLFDVSYGLGRAIPNDARDIIESGADAYVYLPFDLTPKDEVFQAIQILKDSGKILRISLPRIYEIEFEKVKPLIERLSRFEPNSFVIPDTTGKSNPSKVTETIRKIKQFTAVDIDVHFHNDYGCALLNSYEAILAGADSVDVTVFGLGERNGITDVGMMIKLLESEGFNLDVEYNEIVKAYDLLVKIVINKIGEEYFVRNFPLWGSNCNTHTAGTHAAFGSIFKGSNFSFNVYTGKNMVKELLTIHNLPSDADVLSYLVKKIKDISSSEGRSIPVDEILTMVREYYDKSN